MLYLLTSAAVALALVTAYFTFFGLAALAPQVSASMVALGLSLELAKYVAVTFVYQNWKGLPRRLKYTLVTVIAMVMLLSSAGVFGYLQSSFSGSLAEGQVAAVRLHDLETRRGELQTRLTAIEQEQRRAPDSAVRSRIQLMREYEDRRKATAEELQRVQEAELQAREKQLTVRAHTGPLAFVAQALDVPVEKAVLWMALLLTLSLDPLAILLSICLVYARTRTSVADNVTTAKTIIDQRNGLVKARIADSPPFPVCDPSLLDPEPQAPVTAAAPPVVPADVDEHLEEPDIHHPDPEDPQLEVQVLPMSQQPLTTKGLPLPHAQTHRPGSS